MRMLLVHAEHFDYEVKERAVSSPEEVGPAERRGRFEDVLVAFCSVENPDGRDIGRVAERAAAEVAEVASMVGAKQVVVYPYAHLSSNLAPPGVALPLLRRLAEVVKARGHTVFRSPFGWYKSFTLKCKGHPLSELSREISLPILPGAQGEAAKAAEEQSYHMILTPDLRLIKPEDYEFQENEGEFRALVEKEALRRGLEGGREPRYLKYCRKFGIQWESYSDVGHMRYGPEGAFMFELVSEYARMLVDRLGIPVFHVRGTNLFDLSVPPVKEHAELYGGRLYEIRVDEKSYVLRYAACHQQFAMVKDWVLSYRDLPLGVFEIADSYRMEQGGELLLCFRVRKLHMPDLHIFCKDLNQAEEVALQIHRKIFEEVAKIQRRYVSLYNTTRKYFEEHREFFRRLLEAEGQPVLVNFVPEKYYWVINIEYNIIDELGRPREIGTFQIDVGNAQRFGITYTDEGGAKRYPPIIHTALIGSIERYLFALLDTAAKAEAAGGTPTIPVWLSPTQVRVIPVSGENLPYAEKVAGALEASSIRVDIDDTDDTLSRKIRRAEMSWIPYIAVVGSREAEGGLVRVRKRAPNGGAQYPASLQQLIGEVKGEADGYPWRPRPLPKHVSRRPAYKGEQ